MSTVSIRFGDTPEEQKKARSLFEEMKEGQREREDGKVLYTDNEGQPVYRILMGGLRPWIYYALSAWSAQDGPNRQFNVGLDASKKRTWGAVLHDSTKDGSTETIIVAEGMRTRKDAIAAAVDYARHLKWCEGAPW